MSPGNEIRIWHSLALKCKRGVLALPWQFIIKASEFLLNIHEVQWIITGLAIITNFSKCTDKRVKYIIFPYVTRMDDLNGFLKLGNFILTLNMFYTLSHFAQCNPFYPLFPFLVERKWKREGTERQGEKCHLLVSECFSTALIHLCQQHVSTFLFFLTAPKWGLEVHWFTQSSASP